VLQAWLKEWIYETRDHAEYLDKLGAEYFDELGVDPRFSEPVNYGSRR
jgi:glutaconate CoA-transferase subunit A